MRQLRRLHGATSLLFREQARSFPLQIHKAVTIQSHSHVPHSRSFLDWFKNTSESLSAERLKEQANAQDDLKRVMDELNEVKADVHLPNTASTMCLDEIEVLPDDQLLAKAQQIIKNRAAPEQDKAFAVKLLKILTGKKYWKAWYPLAICFRTGYGVEVNHENAIDLFRALAEHRNHGWSYFGLAMYYSEGCLKGDKNNVQKALDLFYKAAKQGVTPACMNIGNLFTSGKGTETGEPDFAAAYPWYIKAVESGDYKAEFVLGQWHSKGVHVPQDYFVAFDWFSKSAAHGEVKAMYNVATYYFLGRGVEQDLGKAAIVYGLAGDKGHAESLLNLANMYRFGYGVSKSVVEAKKYYKKAVHFGQGTEVGQVAEESFYQMDTDEAGARWEDFPEIFIELDERVEGDYQMMLVEHSDGKEWGG